MFIILHDFFYLLLSYLSINFLGFVACNKTIQLLKIDELFNNFHDTCWQHQNAQQNLMWPAVLCEYLCRVLLFLAQTGFIPCRYIDFYLIIPGATVCNFNWSPIHNEGISGDHSAGFGEYKKGRTKINILLSRSMMQQFMLCYFDVIWLVEKQSKSKYLQCNWKLIF